MKIYVVRTDLISQSEFDYLLKILPMDRQKQILSQKSQQNATNMLVGSILARVALKKEFGLPVKEQIFELGEHGKPFLKNGKNQYFNISHSGCYVVCAVSENPVGIDVEVPGKYKEELARKVLSPLEFMNLSHTKNKHIEFSKLWTKKEAYVKMLGQGIRLSNIVNVPTNSCQTLCFEDWNLKKSPTILIISVVEKYSEDKV